jgi:hypothetical protein
MKKLSYTIARNEFINFILTKDPQIVYHNSKVWKKYVVVVQDQDRCRFFDDFFDAAKYLKKNNFEGFIFSGYCRNQGATTEIAVAEVI